ncbi:hypothetical protein AcV5_002348 [Taiwanofungus camphoratus]|nr:hypothetical protein AcV5_002348 [Antrodia cinnamomea]
MLRFLRGGSRLSIASESRPVANDQTTMIVPEAEWDANANGVQIHVTPGPSPPEPPSYDDAIDPSFTRLPETHSSDPGSLSNSEGSSNARVYSNGQATGSSPAIVDNGQVYLFPPRHFGPVIYIFSQETFHSMVLCARGESTPDYYISVAMNCFIPSSYITTIQRGGSRDGELVGSFEMGISTRKNTVTVDGREKLMDLVLCHAGSKSNRVWQWRWHNDDSLHLSWHSDSPVRYVSPCILEFIPVTTYLIMSVVLLKFPDGHSQCHPTCVLHSCTLVSSCRWSTISSSFAQTIPGRPAIIR